MQKTLIVGITGASGSVYALRLLEELAKEKLKVHIVASKTAEKVVTYETETDIKSHIEMLMSKDDTRAVFEIEEHDNYFSKVASGSYLTHGMVIVPCSVSTIGSVANGISSNLLHRAAAVCLKERRKLVLVARETPLTSIDLQNMLTLSNSGATILPASPAFYHLPKTYDEVVNFVVGKILDQLEIETKLYKKWGEN